VVVSLHEGKKSLWYVYPREVVDERLRPSLGRKVLTQVLPLELSRPNRVVFERQSTVAPVLVTEPAASTIILLVDRLLNRIVSLGTAAFYIAHMELAAEGGRPAPKRRKACVKRAVKKAAKKAVARSGTRQTSLVSKAFDVVPVMFATDRKPANDEVGACKFSNERCDDGKLRYGFCEVSIPKTHKVGELESPSWLHIQFRSNPRKHITLLRCETLRRIKFFSDLRKVVSSSPKKDAFVFVHGYNVGFEDAARRTGQIAYDLKFQGAPILYSWPSKNKLTAYTADEATVEVSAEQFQRFVREVANLSGAEVVHIIAHSMGNRAVLLAMERLAAQTALPHLSNVILTAPDIDVERFYQIADAIRGYPVKTTLYASSKDKALQESQRRHKYARAGQSGKAIVVTPGVDTVDASLVDTDLFSLGHSYFSNKRTVLSDVSDLMEGKRPGDRFQLCEKLCSRGKYWAFRP